MKIAQLLNGFESLVSNKEHHFIKNHSSSFSLKSLSEQDQWIAQNLLRKGIYKLSNDGKTLISKE